MFSVIFFVKFSNHHSFHSKKTKIQSKNLAPSILEGLMPITTEDEPVDADDDTPSRVCFLSSSRSLQNSQYSHSSPLSELSTV